MWVLPMELRKKRSFMKERNWRVLLEVALFWATLPPFAMLSDDEKLLLLNVDEPFRATTRNCRESEKVKAQPKSRL
jgi:hypothetical protein